MDRPNERILIRITIGFLTALRASEASLRRPHQSLSINRQCAVFICRCTRRVTGRPAARRGADWDIYRRRGLLGSGLEDMWCEYLTETGWPDGTWILSSLPHSGIGDRVRTGEGVQWHSHSVIFRTTPHSQPCLSDDAALFFILFPSKSEFECTHLLSSYRFTEEKTQSVKDTDDWSNQCDGGEVFYSSCVLICCRVWRVWHARSQRWWWNCEVNPWVWGRCDGHSVTDVTSVERLKVVHITLKHILVDSGLTAGVKDGVGVQDTVEQVLEVKKKTTQKKQHKLFFALTSNFSLRLTTAKSVPVVLGDLKNSDWPRSASLV